MALASLLGKTFGQFNGTGSGIVSLANITGNNVKVIVIVTSRGIGTFQGHTVSYDGFAMTFDGVQNQDLGGFARGRSLVFSRNLGDVVNKTADVQCDTTSGTGVDTTFSVQAFNNMQQVGSTGSAGLGADFSVSSLAQPFGSDFGIGGLILGTVSSVVTVTGDNTKEQDINHSGSTTHQHIVSVLYSGPGSKDMDYSWVPSASYAHFAVGYALIVGSSAPVILSVNGGVDVPTIALGVPVVGTDFLVGYTKFYYADGTNFSTAIKVLQTIDTVTPSTFNWSTIDTGTVGAGANYVFVIVDEGGPNELISAAFAVTVITPGDPDIVDVDGGSTADVTETNLPVNGTDLFTVGLTTLYLADGTTFVTAAKVLQVISGITAPTLNWDVVNEGALGIGALWLFVVTDEGGINEKISVAFPITITEPTVPDIITVDAEFPPADVFFVGLNLAIVGTNFLPPGATKVWLADGTNFATATKFEQTVSAITATTINWDSVTQGTLNPGLLYLFVVTASGTPQEMPSIPFACIVYEVLTPIISSVNGAATVFETDTNLLVTGQFFKRPGNEAFYLADGTTFGAATTQVQSITILDFTTFTWPSIVVGAVGIGNRWLFYVTDEGGPNEQFSAAFPINILPEPQPRIESIGDDTGMVLCPVVDGGITIEPEANVLVIRDHANWTGVGDWYFGRDFEQWPQADNDITLKGQLSGPWPGSKSVRINDVAVTDADRILADENLTVFSGVGRGTFVVGIWIHKADLVDNDVDHCSLYQLEMAAPGEYIELFVTTSGGALHLGVAYDSGGREFMIHSESLTAATEDRPGWVHVIAEWSDSGDFLRLVQGGNEEVSSPGVGPTAGVYEYSFIVHDFALVGGPSTPNIYYRFAAFWYGFGSVDSGEITTLGASATLALYESNVRAIMSGMVATDGPLHYYRCDDLVPDRFIHNHSEDFEPGRAIGGVIQRDLDVSPYGVAKRLFSGCYFDCPVGGNANFDDWGATMFAHIRFLGTVNDVGVLFRLLDQATGASIELSKISAGVNPNEVNGRLRFRAFDNGPTPLIDVIWTNPSLDPFDGTFIAYGVTTSETGTSWKISFGDIGVFTVLSLGVSSVPTWHGFSYTAFQIGGLNMDVHSCGYHSGDDLDIHDLWYATWTTVAELLDFAQQRNYDGFYWCQNDVGND